ncbi:LuxR C-terminal-related transcriptional regulator [Hydrogenophaga intermedia]|uniref:LuxR C-terminal-related transcriptional regulator n=1 Tax=Hydrogenophaga intermedia TaxID=65786 RepID=UPI002042DBB0|nr:response regulator transcription factor [Hydrogenophaga intermedia]MCM3563131.1 response regulator transcription factor [Hydrogenophaga intermedia]
MIVDETALIREGLKTTLKLLGRSLQVEEAECWERVAARCQEASHLDLILLDEDLLPSWSADDFATLRRRQPELKIVMVSNRESGSSMREALRHGVNGYLSKKVSSRLLTSALQLVLDGGTYVSPDAIFMAESAADLRRAAAPAALHVGQRNELTSRLTARQQEVLAQLMKGNSNKLICRELGMAMGTVKSHLAAIFSALQVSSRTAAIAAVTQARSPHRT